VQPGDGPVLETPTGDAITVKADTRSTNGSLTVLELVVAPGSGPARHIHVREDEVWWVLEGDFRFKAGNTMFRASTGGMAFGPRGLPHNFQNIGDTPGRLLIVTSPSGVERSSSSSPPCPARWTPTRWAPSDTRTGSSSSARRWRCPIPLAEYVRTRPVIVGRSLRSGDRSVPFDRSVINSLAYHKCSPLDQRRRSFYARRRFAGGPRMHFPSVRDPGFVGTNRAVLACYTDPTKVA
jgi:mannose-6-phosphate isomerase-like protein (cupin superfamily)